MCTTGHLWWRLRLVSLCQTVKRPLCLWRFDLSTASISVRPMDNRSSGKAPSAAPAPELHSFLSSPSSRYQLSNGDTRYERTYWLPVGKGRSVLARRGFFSVPLPSSQYSTVYYRADHQGYHVDTRKYSSLSLCMCVCV